MRRPSDEVVERRAYVALLFSDVSDYTKIIEASDPEDADELRGSIVQIAQRVVAAHGGAANQFVGDGILAVFGFPTPDEHSVRRAIDAAIELHAAVTALTLTAPSLRGLAVRVHSGVHSGLVFLRQGNPLAGKYELTGDPVNTASRLCSAAGRDEIVVSQATLHGLESYFEVEPVAPLELKGKRHPVPACRVLRARPDAPQTRPLGRLGFIGRREQLGELEQALFSAIQQPGRVVCVVGDAGIGKTRLLREFANKAPAFAEETRVLRGFCENYGDVAPLRPFLQIVREVLPIARDVPEEQALLRLERALSDIDDALRAHMPALAHLLSLRTWRDVEGPEALQFGILNAITSLLLALGNERPLVLILDDWQWADDASMQVLGRLTQALKDRPLLVLVGARGIEAGDPVLGQAARIELLPFTLDESLHAVETLARRPVKGALALGIHARSGGNPFFLEEICQSLPDAGELDLELEDGAVPRTVRDLIHVRVERLPDASAELLRCAAVLGNEFPLWMLVRVSADPAIDPTLQGLVAAGFLTLTAGADAAQFRHGITREVVYESVRVRERRRIHAAVAEVIEERFVGIALGDHYELLASHYAGAANYEKALEFAERAGDKALTSSALDRARAQFAAALSHLDQLPATPDSVKRRLSLIPKWASTSVFSPATEQLAVLSSALELARALNDDVGLRRMEYWLGWIQYALGDQRSAITHLTRALELAESARDERMVAQLLASLGQAHAAAGEYDRALALLERGIEMKRLRVRPGRPGALPVGFAYALGWRGLVHGDRGQFNAAYVQVREALELVKDSGHAVEGSLLCLLGMIQLWQGRWRDALLTAAQGKATAERVNGPYVLAICQTVASYARFELGEGADALADLRRAITRLESSEIGLYLGFGYSHLAQALLEAAELQAARDFAMRALARAERDDPLGEAMSRRVLALIYAREQNQAAALAECELSQASATRRGSERDSALARLTLGKIQLAFGDLERAREPLEAARVALRAMSMGYQEAEAAQLLAECNARRE